MSKIFQDSGVNYFIKSLWFFDLENWLISSPWIEKDQRAHFSIIAASYKVCQLTTYDNIGSACWFSLHRLISCVYPPLFFISTPRKSKLLSPWHYLPTDMSSLFFLSTVMIFVFPRLNLTPRWLLAIWSPSKNLMVLPLCLQIAKYRPFTSDYNPTKRTTCLLLF